MTKTMKIRGQLLEAGRKTLKRRGLPQGIREKLHAVMVVGTAQCREGNVKALLVMQAAEKAASRGQENQLDNCLKRLVIWV